jgi:hypothetical protein
MENVVEYTTTKGKNMRKMNCIVCKSNIHRFASRKKAVVEEPQKEIILKEIKAV